ncbi:GNAT family N-acetyltransferase [Micromonospora sp. NPDC000089]|uniref:GNAT family N-acetyltransferase n=1 Tax=unclassified Micromonospora TaxID=2617518 RepID=UPI0036CB6FFE
MPSVAPAEPADAAGLAILLEEMDRFYGATEFAAIEDRVAEIKANVFDSDAGICVLLARDDDGELVGFASYSYLWPAVGLTRSLFLKELYVSASHRGKGIGRQLVDALRMVAVESGCSRVEWTTDRGNINAQRFYARLGVQQLPAKVFYRMAVGPYQ